MSAENMINWALNTGLDISILIVLVLVCRRFFVKMFGARAAYALWVLPLFRLVMPQTPITIPKPSWMQTGVAVPDPVMVSGTAQSIFTNQTAPPITQIQWHIPVLVLWLGVAAIWLGVLFWRQHKFIKSVYKTSAPISGSVRAKLARACKNLKLNTCPEVRIAKANIGPLVAGVFKPVILLPQDFEENFSTHQQVFALTHELAHIKRGDLWAAFAGLVFRALNWPNPLVHYCAVKFRTDQEAACDAYVLSTINGGSRAKQNYAATLLHSAKLAAPEYRTQTQNRLAAPLSLTIYHPLKERLMTLKTSKTNSTILSRLGVGAFLVAALTVTAPITFAAGPQTSGAQVLDAPTPPAPPKIKTQSKRVMKWIENNNGVETTKHFEITEEDGVTTAYSIDEHGNRTLVDVSEIGMKDGQGTMNMFVMDNEDGDGSIKIMMSDELGDLGDLEGLAGAETLHMTGDGHSKIFIKRMTTDDDGMIINMNEDAFVMDAGGRTSTMVSAAQSLLEQADDKDLSNKARRKLEKARKALAEAQEAIEAEE